jgi:hypothetical protein
MLILIVLVVISNLVGVNQYVDVYGHLGNLFPNKFIIRWVYDWNFFISFNAIAIGFSQPD